MGFRNQLITGGHHLVVVWPGFFTAPSIGFAPGSGRLRWGLALDLEPAGPTEFWVRNA